MNVEHIMALVREYGVHFFEAAEHQSSSRADISKTAVLKKLGEIRAALEGQPEQPPAGAGGQWQPIETAPRQERVLLFSPPQNLWEDHAGKPGEIRVARSSEWTWASHWMPLPAPPAPSQSEAPTASRINQEAP
jgi:hypothetical protein